MHRKKKIMHKGGDLRRVNVMVNAPRSPMIPAHNGRHQEPGCFFNTVIQTDDGSGAFI